MVLNIALAGNPNAGKSTLFNLLTGSEQYVGNWPGVTVEKKTGRYLNDPSINLIDLPGVYSLTPYSMEEVITKDYLFEEVPDVIINIIDATNIERNLYLSTQLIELGIPVVLAFNRADIIKRRGEKVNFDAISEGMGCPGVVISAMKNSGIEELMNIAKEEAKKGIGMDHPVRYSAALEEAIIAISNISDAIKKQFNSRGFAIKIIEGDAETIDKLHMTEEERKKAAIIVDRLEKEYDLEGEDILAEERYGFIDITIIGNVEEKNHKLSTSDKIDHVVTNRILAIPIFVVIMVAMYYIALVVVGGTFNDWWNDVVIGEVVIANVAAFLETTAVAPWLQSLIVHGILGGVGSVIGFMPLIVTVFIFISIFEDIGYMSRVAFILDRIFRKFGLSGKSFIPILIGVGCSVPGIMATRTIENENDRRMTIAVASFMPCGAKTEIIAVFAGSIFSGLWWFGPLCYFIGIGAVILSGIILKKFDRFAGDPIPFVMELPEYQLPNFQNVGKKVWDRTKDFIIKAGTVIFAASVIIWLLQNISLNGEFHEFAEEGTNSILSGIGHILAPFFEPLGFGNWIAAVSSLLGLIAKEIVVSTLGVLSGLGELSSEDPSAMALASSLFTSVSGLSFMVFNQLTVPCFAAVGAIRQEMNSPKWTMFALGYQLGFSYLISLMIYQFGRVIVLGEPVNFMTGVGVAALLFIIFLAARPMPQKK